MKKVAVFRPPVVFGLFGWALPKIGLTALFACVGKSYRLPFLSTSDLWTNREEVTSLISSAASSETMSSLVDPHPLHLGLARRDSSAAVTNRLAPHSSHLYSLFFATALLHEKTATQ